MQRTETKKLSNILISISPIEKANIEYNDEKGLRSSHRYISFGLKYLHFLLEIKINIVDEGMEFL